MNTTNKQWLAMSDKEKQAALNKRVKMVKTNEH